MCWIFPWVYFFWAIFKTAIYDFVCLKFELYFTHRSRIWSFEKNIITLNMNTDTKVLLTSGMILIDWQQINSNEMPTRMVPKLASLCCLSVKSMLLLSTLSLVTLWFLLADESAFLETIFATSICWVSFCLMTSCDDTFAKDVEVSRVAYET